MAYLVMAYIGTNEVQLPIYNYGLYSYGLYSYGLYRHERSAASARRALLGGTVRTIGTGRMVHKILVMAYIVMA